MKPFLLVGFATSMETFLALCKDKPYSKQHGTAVVICQL
jgi:hypothetical protein